MTRDEVRDRVAALLEEVGQAHHAVAPADARPADGDPEWPLWYAQRLAAPLAEIVSCPFTVSGLTRVLQQLADEHAARAPESPWARHYADQLVARFHADPDESLSLYHFTGCPYCVMVRRVIDELGVDVELRDINVHDEHWQDLVDARGRATVPVLRCTHGDVDRWMPESRDIIDYLRRRFG